MGWAVTIRAIAHRRSSPYRQVHLKSPTIKAAILVGRHRHPPPEIKANVSPALDIDLTPLDTTLILQAHRRSTAIWPTPSANLCSEPHVKVDDKVAMPPKTPTLS